MVRSFHLRSLFSIAVLTLVACGTENGATPRAIGTSQSELKSCGGPNFVEGIDVSHYETVDFAKVKASGVAFAIMKATEGTGYVDPTFASYYAEAKANGLVRGAYHFHRASSDPKQQIDHFLANVSPTAGDLPLILDVEDVNSGMSASAITANVLACLQYLEQKTGRKPMMYTGMWYWSGNMNNPLGFDKYPLWMSSYPASWASAQNHTACPSIPSDFPGWVMWQYSDGSQSDAPSVAGVGKSCDRNFFNGTLGELMAFASTGASTGGGGSTGAGGGGVGAGGSGTTEIYAAKYVKQSWPLSSAPAIQMKVGQTLTGSIDMKNTGTAVWPAGVVKLAPIPRDKPSAFKSPSWLAANRVSTVAADVAPGQVGHFEWDFTPSVAGDFSPYFGLVADGITWFADSGGPQDNDIQVHIVVAPGPAMGAGGAGAAGGAGPVGAGGAAMGPGPGAGGGVGVGAGGGSVSAGGAGVSAGGMATSAGGGSSVGGASATLGGGGKTALGGASAKGGAGGAPPGVVDAAAPGESGGCTTAVRAPSANGGWLALAVALGALAKRRSSRSAQKQQPLH